MRSTVRLKSSNLQILDFPTCLLWLWCREVPTLPDIPFHIQQTRKGITSVRDISTSKFPTRVHLRFHDERFDIVFPWEYTSMARDYRAEWTLSIPADPLHDYWHQLVQKLQGYRIGIGLQEDISLLNSFVSTCFQVQECRRPLENSHPGPSCAARSCWVQLPEAQHHSSELLLHWRHHSEAMGDPLWHGSLVLR